MILRVTLFGLIATGLLGFGLVAWVATHPIHAHASARPDRVAVLTAAHPLRPGGLLKPEDLAARKLARAQIPHGATRDTPAARRALTGAMVRRSLAAGDVILPQDVLRPGDHGFLAAVLAPGMRAVTVGVDAVSGTAGLIWPGDRVDLILTQTTSDPTVPPARRVAAETVLADVRVIAIDQRLVEGAAPSQPTGHRAQTVTLEVTAAEAERVAVATRLGHLSLAVRSAEPARLAGMEPAPTVWAGDVAHALATQAPRGTPATVRVWQGTADGKEFHF